MAAEPSISAEGAAGETNGQACEADKAGPVAGTSAARAGYYELAILGGDVVALHAVRYAVQRGRRVALIVPPQQEPAAASGTEGRLGRRLRQAAVEWMPAGVPQPPEHELLDIYPGPARFIDSRTLAIGERRLRFRRALIATGRCWAKPQIPGSAAAGVLTPAEVERLDQAPARVALIGRGRLACVWAQLFCRSASRVHLVTPSSSLLPEEEPQAAALLAARLAGEGVCIRLQSTAERIERMGKWRAVVVCSTRGLEKLLVDQVVICPQRMPLVEGLGLESAGIAFDTQGVIVDRRMQTTCPGIFAAGSICRGPFGSMAHGPEAARLAARNALGWFAGRLDPLAPAAWVKTDPELVRFGLTGAQARQQGRRVLTLRAELPACGGGQAERGKSGPAGRPCAGLVGITAVGEHAAELIAALRVSLAHSRRLEGLLRLWSPPGSRLEAMRHLAEKWAPVLARRRRTRWRKRLRLHLRRLAGQQ